MAKGGGVGWGGTRNCLKDCIDSKAVRINYLKIKVSIFESMALSTEIDYLFLKHLNNFEDSSCSSSCELIWDR